MRFVDLRPALRRWILGVTAIALATALLATSSCSSSTDDHAADAPATTAVTVTTATPRDVPGSTPAGDLAFLGPVHRLDVGDVTMGYRQFGAGPPLVLVVGQDSTMSYWGPDLPRRLAEHFTVTIFDNRGIGYTTDPATEPLTIQQMADDTAGLLDALALDHPTLFGWSTGGEIALALAVRHPGRLGPLVVSGATAGGPDSTPTPPDLQALLASTDLADQAELLDELFTPSGTAARDAYVRGLLAMPDEPLTPPAVARQADAEATFATDASIADQLGSIAGPVLVTDGASDRLVPPANATLIADRIPGSQLLLVADTSHGWMLQQLDRFVATVVAFSEGRPLP